MLRRIFKRPRRFWIGLSVAAIVIIGLVLLFFIIRQALFRETLRFAHDQADIEDHLDVSLPSTASDLHFDSFKFFGYLLWIRFNVTPDDELTEFFDALHVLGEGSSFLEEGSNPFAEIEVDSPGGWWTPDNAQTFIGGSFWNRLDTHPLRFFAILVDQDDDTQWTVYLHVYDDL